MLCINSLLGHLGFGSPFIKSQCLGLTDIPKLFITLFLSCVILNINGCSPLASVLLLKQITEIVTLIILRFTQRFTQQLLYVML